MPSTVPRFNLIISLILGGTLLLLTGCRSNDEKKIEATTLRLHIQTNPTPLDRHMTVPIGREGTFELVVEEDAFLSEIFITEATLVEVIGGFEIKLKFDRKGTVILNQFTTANKSKRIGIHATFGEARWIAAPVIRARMSDGLFTFTPDATREEAERIVRGLMNVAGEVRNENR